MKIYFKVKSPALIITSPGHLQLGHTYPVPEYSVNGDKQLIVRDDDTGDLNTRYAQQQL